MGKLNIRLVHILVIVFCGGFASSLVLPIVPYLASEMNGTGQEIGVMFTGFAIGSLISSYVNGIISDKYGRKPMLLLASGGQFLGSLAQYFAGNMTWLIITRTFFGCFDSIFTLGQACVADVTTVKTRAQHLSEVDGILSTGYIIGSFLGGVLSQINLRVPILLSTFIFLFAFLYVLFLFEESSPIAVQKKEAKKRLQNYRKQGRLSDADRQEQIIKNFYKYGSTDGDASKFRWSIFIVCALLVQFGNMFIYSGIESMYAVYGEEKYGMTAMQFSTLTSIISLLNAIQQTILYSMMINKLNLSIPGLSMIAAVIQAIGLIITSFAPSLLVSSIGIILTVFGFGFISPAAPSILSTECPPHLQGLAMGYIVLAGQGSYAIAPTVVSWVLKLNRELGYSSCSLLSLLIFISMFIVRAQPGGKQIGKEERQGPSIDTIKEMKEIDKLEELSSVNNDDLEGQLGVKENIEIKESENSVYPTITDVFNTASHPNTTISRENGGESSILSIGLREHPVYISEDTIHIQGQSSSSSTPTPSTPTPSTLEMNNVNNHNSTINRSRDNSVASDATSHGPEHLFIDINTQYSFDRV
ncbi:hypothetical protein WA158_001192 [Blastocystis sp. Blastoise]